MKLTSNKDIFSKGKKSKIPIRKNLKPMIRNDSEDCAIKRNLNFVEHKNNQINIDEIDFISKFDILFSSTSSNLSSKYDIVFNSFHLHFFFI